MPIDYENENYLEYSCECNTGCGGFEGHYEKKNGLLLLRYGSVGDRAVRICAEIDIKSDKMKNIVRFNTMNYRFEDYDEEARGSFKMYTLYKKRCEITSRIIEDFIREVFGNQAVIEINMDIDTPCTKKSEYFGWITI